MFYYFKNKDLELFLKGFFCVYVNRKTSRSKSEKQREEVFIFPSNLSGVVDLKTGKFKKRK